MTGNFIVKYSNKDIMDKMEDISTKVDALHTLAEKTNGKVKLHTRLIFGCFGFTSGVLVVFIGYIL